MDTLRSVLLLVSALGGPVGERGRAESRRDATDNKSDRPEPADAFVLLKIASAASNYLEFRAPAFKWAEALDLPDDIVAGALRRLAAKGYFQVMAQRDGEPGRPALLYELSASLKKVLGGNSESVHPIVCSLLHPPTEFLKGKKAASADSPPQKVGAATRMDIRNRLVLVALWVMADGQGVVRGLGTNELARYCLMDPLRFQRQTEKLMGLGFIRTYVPGTSGSPFIGRVPGTYFLNMRHPLFGPLKIPGFTWLYHPELIFGEHAKRDGGYVRHVARLARSPFATVTERGAASPFESVLLNLLPDITPAQVKKLRDTFRLLRSDQVTYLEAEVERVASEALSADWRAISEEGVGSGEWLDARSKAIFGAGASLAGKSESSNGKGGGAHGSASPSTTESDRLPDLFVTIVRKLAWAVKRVMSVTILSEGDSSRPNHEAMNHLIIPYMKASGGVHFVIESTYKVTPQNRAHAMYVLMGTSRRQMPCVDEPTSDEKLTPRRLVFLGLQAQEIGKVESSSGK